MKLDLETLKHVKFSFDIFSDHSSRCLGYKSLCNMIEKEEARIKEEGTPITEIPQDKYCQIFFDTEGKKKCEYQCSWCANKYDMR